jgi:hypothetical protein
MVIDPHERSTTINIRGESYRLEARKKAGLFPRPEEDGSRAAPFPTSDRLINGLRRLGSTSSQKNTAPYIARIG